MYHRIPNRTHQFVKNSDVSVMKDAPFRESNGLLYARLRLSDECKPSKYCSINAESCTLSYQNERFNCERKQYQWSMPRQFFCFLYQAV